MSLFLGNRDQGRTSEVGHNLVVKRVLGQGVSPNIEVTEDSPTRMAIRVTKLTALIEHSNNAIYEAYQTGTDELAITNSNASNPRVDTLVCYIDRQTSPDDTTSNNPNLAVLAIVAGTPAGSPVGPTDAIINTAVSSNPYVRVADIRVNAGVSTIVNANITILDTSLSLGSDWSEADATSSRYINNKPDTTGTGLISDTERTKVDGIETSATKDQTATEVRNLLQGLSVTTKMTEAGLRDDTLTAGKLSNTLKLATGWLTIAASISASSLTHLQSRRQIGLTLTNSWDLTIGDRVSFLANSDSTRRYYGIITSMANSKIYLAYAKATDVVPTTLTQIVDVMASKLSYPAGLPDITSGGIWDYVVEAPTGGNITQNVSANSVINIRSGSDPRTGYFMDLPVGKWDVEWGMTSSYTGAGRRVGISTSTNAISDNKLITRYGGTSQLHGETKTGTGYISNAGETNRVYAILNNPNTGSTQFTFSDQPRFWLRLKLRAK